MKEFLLLIRENAEYGKMTALQMQEDIEKQIAWVEKLIKKENFKEGNPLDSKGSFIIGKNKIVTDGPYVESKECISGYYFIFANSLLEATEIAKGCPSLDTGATLEIREVVQIDE
jgi:hypothetical protein